MLSLVALVVALTISSSDVKKSEVEEGLAAPLLQGARAAAPPCLLHMRTRCRLLLQHSPMLQCSATFSQCRPEQAACSCAACTGSIG